jgi:hypothetical protein
MNDPFNDPTSPFYDPPTATAAQQQRKNFHKVKYDLEPLRLGIVEHIDITPEPGKHQSVRNAASAYGKRTGTRYAVSLIPPDTLRITRAPI